MNNQQQLTDNKATSLINCVLSAVSALHALFGKLCFLDASDPLGDCFLLRLVTNDNWTILYRPPNSNDSALSLAVF